MSKLIEIWRLLNLPCEQMTHLASQALDRDLSFWPRLAFRLHLLYCKACRRYKRHLLFLRAALRRIAADLAETDPGFGPGLSAAARERIARALRDQ